MKNEEPINKELCPYCNSVLELGEAMTPESYRLWWRPKTQAIPMFAGLHKNKMINEGSFLIYSGSSGRFSGVLRFPARVCRNCGYMIIWADESNAKYHK